MKNTQSFNPILKKENIDTLAWKKMNGMIPVITQDINTGEILMQAYVNKQSLDKTMKTGNATYWSRSKNQLWEKGLTSGNNQKVYEVIADCDGDCLIYKVEQLGNPPVACHTGERSCFHNSIVQLYQNTSTQTGNILYKGNKGNQK